MSPSEYFEMKNISKFKPCSMQQMIQLRDLLKDIKFFEERFGKGASMDLLEISLTILIEHFHSKDLVFDYGDKGSKFYIILKGELGVDVPSN